MAAAKQQEKEDGSLTHAKNITPRECLICMSDIEMSSYVEFQRTKSNPLWYPAKCCSDCLAQMIKVAWPQYKKLAESESCPKAFSAAISKGPPSRISGQDLLPNNEAKNELGVVTGEVHALWFGRDNHTETGELPDALRGEALAKWWARVVARKRVINSKGEPEMLPIEPEVAASPTAITTPVAAAVKATASAAAVAAATSAASAASAAAVTAALESVSIAPMAAATATAGGK